VSISSDSNTIIESESLPQVANQKTIDWGKDNSQMVLIPAGPDTESFYMDKYEVTNAQYRKFMEATGHREPEDWDNDVFNQPDQPVVGVSWNDAVAYTKWVGKRLPTEKEWEYAARGGLVGQCLYPWGDKEPDGSQGNYADKNADQILRQMDKTFDWADMTIDDGYAWCAPVGSYPPNGYGLYDMAGNVCEWCQDVYNENPSGPSRGEIRVLRGGSWNHNSYNLRVDNRNLNYANNWSNHFGFRCVSGSN